MAGPNRARARELAAQFRAAGDFTGWFEALYREQEQGRQVVPWADMGVNPSLLEYFQLEPVETAGRSAIVVGCGYGDDAEQLAAWGFETTGFDISSSAIEACRRRFPESRVNYQTADLLNPPADWRGRFDFVLESNTLQSLPPELREQAISGVAGFVSQNGMVLVMARAREEHDPVGLMPWPLTRGDLDLFVTMGLIEKSFEDYFDRESPRVRRFRAVFVR
jgi:2-polyprenyl-3-methyl-5-hydroxy-6-metoxy-1,4-benzoquinol methylase